MKHFSTVPEYSRRRIFRPFLAHSVKDDDPLIRGGPALERAQGRRVAARVARVLRGGDESRRSPAAARPPDRRERCARPHVSFDGPRTANNPLALRRLFAVKYKADRTIRRRRRDRPLGVTGGGRSGSGVNLFTPAEGLIERIREGARQTGKDIGAAEESPCLIRC